MKLPVSVLMILLVVFVSGCGGQKKDNVPAPEVKKIEEKPKLSLRKDGPYKLVNAKGQVLAQGEYKEKRFTGIVKSYYPNERIKEVSNYKNNLLDGNYKIYSDKGKVLEDKNYKDGHLEGSFKRFYDTGMLQSEMIYRNGYLAQTTHYNLKGKPLNK